MKDSEIYEFTLEHNGQPYQCTRTVHGEKRLWQHVSVIGYGAKKDPSYYGERGYAIKGMAKDAELIAIQILDERL